MMPAEPMPSLIERLPPVRGRLEAAAPLARYTWFKTGGPAEVLFQPADADDLAAFLAAVDPAVPVTVFGNASNLLIRDGGIDGVVIRLGRAFSAIAVDGLEITAGAGAADLNVARAARDAGIAGLEFLAGVPGAIGGAVRMNAGAYGGEIADVLVSADVVGSDGIRATLTKDAIGFSYRRSGLAEGAIVVAVRLKGEAGDKDAIAARMDDIQRQREASQPVRTMTGGSTFKNPQGHKAWELVDAAGCRGLRRGQAVVSEQHCNFLVNEGGATAADLEGLGEEVRRRVMAHAGIELEWEIRRVGKPAGAGLSEVTS
jgi:UDP-N-acetylmuramate dehydrogenase